MAVEPNHSHSKEIVMTAINTNTAALNAQYYLAKSNKDMESSMAKLSSGQKVNSAADDRGPGYCQPHDSPDPWSGNGC